MAGQTPQSILPPQPYGHSPQFLHAGHWLSGTHAGFPHLFATPPPPQVLPGAQGGHVRTLPQPSPV